jgi:hypothetical protein
MRPDRSCIKDERIKFVMNNPLKEEIQSDGETVHNAFFDRDFEEE